MQIDIAHIGSATLERESRKSFSMRVFPNGEVLVKAPVEATDTEIDRFIARKRKWLLKQINFFDQFKENKPTQIVAGMDVLYLGKHYQLIVKDDSIDSYVKVGKGSIVLFSSGKEDIKKILDSWLQRQIKKVFVLRLKHCLKQFPNIVPPKLKVRKLNKRWGSYLKSNVVILNPLLIRATTTAIDYVITHELCHAFYKKHNQQFYNLLTTHIPNWKIIDRELEQTVWGK